MFLPHANHKATRPWQGGRGAGNLGAFAEVRNPPTVFLTGTHGAPSWPSGSLPQLRQALPKADTKRQDKADRRLAEKGGQLWLSARRGFLKPARRRGA